MAKKFGNSWFVRKDRIQMFLPLADSLKFEIDRTEVGSASSQRGNPVFGTELGATDASGNPLSLKYNDAEVSALIFPSASAGNEKYVEFNDRISETLNNVIYRAGGKATISFWAYPMDNTDVGMFGVGVDSNVILGDSYTQGYTFGVDSQTSVIGMADGSALGSAEDAANNILPYKDEHVLTARRSMVDTDDGINVGLKEWDGTSQRVDVPERQWVFVSYVMDHTDTVSFKTTMHMRFYRTSLVNGNSVTMKTHYFKTSTGMSEYTIDGQNVSVVGRTSGKWTLGCAKVPSGAGSVAGLFFTGAVRNLMIHSIALTDDQMDRMFENGIDPYVALWSQNTAPDSDQYDKQFWGKYGIIATRSGVKIEKTLANNYVDSSQDETIPQAKRRFVVASRDNATISIERDDVIEGETSNPPIVDYTPNADPTQADERSFNGFGSSDANGDDITESGGNSVVMAFSAGSWRGGSVDGDFHLSQKNSKSMWGGMISGKTDMMRLEPYRYDEETRRVVSYNDPVNLPSGKYIVDIVNGLASDSQQGYPPYLPKYYYRDRLGRSYRRKGSTFTQNNSSTVVDEHGTPISGLNGSSNVYVDEIFWDSNTPRYDKIAWDKAIVDNNGEEVTTIDELVADGTLAGETAALVGKVNNNSPDQVQVDFYSKWSPIRWAYAVYEIERGQMIKSQEQMTETGGFGGYIKLLLVSSDFRMSAVYYKYRNPVSNTYSDWHFDSFNFAGNNTSSSTANSVEDHMAKETIARVFLPHAAIPKLMIPMFHDTVNVDRKSIAGIIGSTDLAQGTADGGIIEEWHYDYDKIGWKMNGSMSTLDKTIIANTTAPASGWYAVFVTTMLNMEDTIRVANVSVNGIAKPITQHVRSDSGTSTSLNVLCTIPFFVRVMVGQQFIMAVDIDRARIVGYTISYVSNPAIAGGSSIVGVSMTNVNEADTNYANYVTKGENGKEYITIEGIGVKYTRKNYKSLTSGTGLSPEISSTLLDQSKSQYEE